MEEVVVSAPGKIILTGEHSVVYGYPAIVAAVDRQMKVRVKRNSQEKLVIKPRKSNTKLVRWAVKECLRIKGEDEMGYLIDIESSIPMNKGMGSSAALATGLVWGLLKGESDEIKNKVIKKFEDKQHGKSSGVDQMIVREGGVMRYQKGVGFSKFQVRYLEYTLIDSGRALESTGEMVKMVTEKYMANKGQYDRYFERMGEIAENWEADLIQENQRLLEKIGVVGERARKIVRKVEKIGGMAKVCGAGGVKEGSGIILVDCKNSEGFSRLVTTNRWRTFLVKLGVGGVKYEKD